MESTRNYYNISGETNISNIDILMHFQNHTFSTILMDTTTEYMNYTNVTNPNTYQSTLKLYDIFIPLIGSISIILNSAVVISSGLILKKGQQPRSTYLFLGNVAMTDLITAIMVVFGQMYPSKYRDHYVCVIQIGLIVSSTLSSIYSVGLIAVDRFLYILHGLQYQRWVYPTRARMCIGITWLIGLLVGFMPLFGWYGYTDNGRICWFIKLAPKGLIVLTVVIGSIPLITVIVLYSMILYNAIKNIYRLQRAQRNENENKIPENGLRMFRGRSPEVSEESANATQQPEKNIFKKFFTRHPTAKVSNPSKWKAIKVVMFTSGSFMITWGPYFVISLLYAYCDDPEKSKRLSYLIASPLAILGFFNTLINPIIYAWWHKGFREFIKLRFKSLRKKREQSVSPETSKNTSSTSPRKDSDLTNSSEEVVKITPMEKTNENP